MSAGAAPPGEGRDRPHHVGDAGDAGDTVLVRSAAELVEIAERAARADRVAVDAEANGLFAFRPALCTLQLAFRERGETVVAVIDTIAVGALPLAPLLGPGGPIKVLHDLTFDARLLADAGAPLARVRDTSVSARLLGVTATGLASMLGSELGVTIDKRFQQHDWSVRPLTEEHLTYLAGDVRHLLELDERLAIRAEALDITEEIADECAYKLTAALGPPRDPRPPYARVKGAGALEPAGRAALRRLFQARDEAAEAANVPPFKVVSSETLLELAQRRPRDLRALRAVRGAAVGRAARHLDAWLAAIEAGVRDADVPPEDRPLFEPARGAPPGEGRRVRDLARARELQITSFRRAEAKRRGVDEQAVLPGHCAQELQRAMLTFGAGGDPGGPESALRRAIAEIPGLGARRTERYLDTLVALGSAPAPAPKGNEKSAPPGQAPPDGE